jgi:hypothetical protein
LSSVDDPVHGRSADGEQLSQLDDGVLALPMQLEQVSLLGGKREEGAGIVLSRQDQTPMRPDLLALFEPDELARYFTDGERTAPRRRHRASNAAPRNVRALPRPPLRSGIIDPQGLAKAERRERIEVVPGLVELLRWRSPA